MRLLPIIVLLAFCSACSATKDVTKKTEPASQSNETTVNLTLPTEERAFVDTINKFNKLSIIEQLGEPAKAEDVRIKGTNKIVASIWHYHYINTDAQGKYFETTELNFIGDKVVQVVFINNDGSEDQKDHTYELPRTE